MTAPDPNAAPQPLTAPFSVGEWRADPAANALARGGETASLEPKVMDLLALLAAAPGRVFSRDELDAAIWPAVTVGEDTLARAVSKLRRALGDSASAPQFVETIPKRGYRLIAPVEPDTPSAVHWMNAASPPRFVIAGLALVALVLAAFFAVRGAQQFQSPDTPQTPAAEATERAHDLYMRFTRADNEAAIALYERAIAADPDYAPAQAGLANALVQRVIRWQTPPGAAPSATTLADALSAGITETGNAQALLARAVDLGERAVRLAPRDADALKSLGFAYSAAGDLARAREVYERAVGIDADAWEVMINLGELASIRGDDEAALGWHQKAYAAMDRLYAAEPQRIGPWRAPLGVLIGDAYGEAGDKAAAEAWYRRVLDQAPLEPVATTRLARLLRARGEAGEAARLCEALNARVGAFEACATGKEAP